MAPVQNDLRFPVIHQFSVSDYQLYPGDHGKGFSYDVRSGVNIVVGVNGLGKTTLLNLLLKLIAGPSHISALTGLGMGSREEVRSNLRFFSARVKDAAASATATATLGFGERRITVTRKLASLNITYLKIGDIEASEISAEAYENRFKRGVLELSGLQQYYDYLLLVHFIFFFLEDRQKLIWDEDAQAEVLRVLYYNPNSQILYRELYNKIAQYDSEIRNTQAVLSRHEKNLQKELLKRADDSSATELKSLLKTLTSLQGSMAVLESETDTLNNSRIAYRDQVEALRVQREAKVSKARAAHEEYLRAEFSSAENEALYAVASVISERGCIFCGSHTERARMCVQQKLDVHHCPLCDAGPGEREQHSHHTDKGVFLATAQVLEVQAEDDSQQIANVDAMIAKVTDQYQSLMRKLVDQRKQHQEVQLQIKIMESGLPKDADELKVLQEKLLGFRDLLDQTKQEKVDAEVALAAIVDPGEARVAETAEAIIRRFKEYITGFMAETCVLQYDVLEKRIGQGPSTVKFRFPRFSVQLTSGVFRDAAANRMSPNDVSESQREFIDLAFRMSLIAEITTRSSAMMVVETPEASLDSVFVPRAGTMIRQFLQIADNSSNYLIASTNLNREAMIPALFGVLPEAEASQYARDGDRNMFEERAAKAVPRDERLGRMVNLLEIAAKNAALTKYEDEYKDEFQRSVFPTWENFDTMSEGVK
jgi:energy-coupling factor transporter ATP-binding protein EcfA2